MLGHRLPEHAHRRYPAAKCCIHCGSGVGLHDEHIVPYALGGRWILPGGSCSVCGGIASSFEGTCTRTMLGPLRMFYDVRSRRKNKRPKTLPLKVRRRLGERRGPLLRFHARNIHFSSACHISLPAYPLHSSGDDGPVRMRLRPGAGVGEVLGQAVELVAAVEAPGEAGKVALGVLGADVMAGAGERGLDVAQGRVHPAALAAPIAQASAVTDGAG